MKKILLFISIGCSILYADILVVVAENSLVKNLSENDIKRLFLNQTRFYPSGKQADVVESASSKVKDSFYRAVTNKSQSQLRAYWAKQIFTGKGKPPRQLKAEKLVQYLMQNPNAISYISPEEMADTLKVIYKIRQ